MTDDPDLSHLPPARPAATLILLRDRAAGEPPHLLMLERSAKMSFAAGAAVFPGGGVDDADRAFAATLDSGLEIDDAAARIAAIRETIEETGLAIGLGTAGADAVPSPDDIAAARQRLHAGEGLASVCARFGWCPRLDALVPWARWRPPRVLPRNYDTRFYIADAGAAHGEATVDATENVALFWADAATIIAAERAGTLSLIIPTRRNLERLALWGTFAAARDHAAQFPVRLLLPYREERADGRYFCIPDGFGYPVLEERAAE